MSRVSLHVTTRSVGRIHCYPEPGGSGGGVGEGASGLPKNEATGRLMHTQVGPGGGRAMHTSRHVAKGSRFSKLSAQSPSLYIVAVCDPGKCNLLIELPYLSLLIDLSILAGQESINNDLLHS